MISLRALTNIFLVLGIIWYRSGSLIKNSILLRSPFPRGYIANGDYTTDCTTIRDAADKIEDSLSSCEDETFWELYDATGKVVQRPVIVSCDPGRRAWNTVMGPLRNPNPRGALWLYVPERTAGKEIKSLLNSAVSANKAHRITFKNYPADHDFHPLGVEVWPSHAGNSSNLYVVNHAREKTVVEQFTINPAKPTEAVHVRTISSAYFISPNGLALTSPDSFYVSNDHLITRRLPVVGHILPLIESVLGLPLGFVSHVTLNEPTSSGNSPIAEHFFAKLFIPFPNGVALSPSGNELAVVSTSLSQILFFERDTVSGKLGQRTDVVHVPFAPDNLHYTPSTSGGKRDELIIAGHPNFPDLTAVAASKEGATAASWVATIVPKEGEKRTAEAGFDSQAPVSISTKIAKDGIGWTLKTLFQSDGIEDKGGFGSSTTGLRDPDSGAIYISGLYAAGGLLVCRPGSGIAKG